MNINKKNGFSERIVYSLMGHAFAFISVTYYFFDFLLEVLSVEMS